MAFLDYSGLGHFLDKLKTIFVLNTTKGQANGVASLDSNGKVQAAQISDMTGAASSAAGTRGFVPAPGAGKNIQYLKGDGTWESPAMSELNLSVADGKVRMTYTEE